MNPMMDRWKKDCKGADEPGTGRPETNEGVLKNSDNVRGTRQQKTDKIIPSNRRTHRDTHTHVHVHIGMYISVCACEIRHEPSGRARASDDRRPRLYCYSLSVYVHEIDYG